MQVQKLQKIFQTDYADEGAKNGDTKIDDKNINILEGRQQRAYTEEQRAYTEEQTGKF